MNSIVVTEQGLAADARTDGRRKGLGEAEHRGRDGPDAPGEPSNRFDLSLASESNFGSISVFGPWSHLMYRGFVTSSTVARRGGPKWSLGRNVTHAEDAVASLTEI
ncbi:homeodomain-like superfamily protein [Striga asiatica]|uniref:Homeodomain-like superfamily protein n=1 Tax=Striga asiatica TaxID=4170 RepID=A0A5A7NXS7_STRAF|nr:homeodomain-like superfamily protein [Striga asiatica]